MPYGQIADLTLTLFLLKCVVTEVALFSIVVFLDTGVQGSVATHLRCVGNGIFSDGIIANVLLILTVK